MPRSDIQDEKDIPPEVLHIETAVTASTTHLEKSKAEKRLVKKIDLLVPAVLSGAYFFGYLVCNATFENLEADS